MKYHWGRVLFGMGMWFILISVILGMKISPLSNSSNAGELIMGLLGGCFIFFSGLEEW